MDSELRDLERTFSASRCSADEDALLTVRWRLFGIPAQPPRLEAEDAVSKQCSECFLVSYSIAGRTAYRLDLATGWSPEAAILAWADAKVRSVRGPFHRSWLSNIWNHHCLLQPLARLKPIPLDRYVRGSLDLDDHIMLDIHARGLERPILITQGFQIVDGMRRYVAASKLHMILVPTELRVVGSLYELEYQQVMLNLSRGEITIQRASRLRGYNDS